MGAKPPIDFGMSNWHGFLCEDFTFENVRVVIQAIADHLAGLSPAASISSCSRNWKMPEPPKNNAVPGEIDGTKVKEIIRIDGTKLLMQDGSWMQFRKSAT